MLALGNFSFSLIVFYLISFLSLFTGVFTILVFLERRKELVSPKIKDYKKVSIVIPAYNEEKNIERSITKVLEVDYPKDLIEIVVVDDGSKDNTYSVVKSMNLDNVKLIKKPNGGKASAVNVGIENSTGDYVMVLDADTFPEKNVFQKALGGFEDPEVMAVTLSIKAYKAEKVIQKMQYIEYTIMNFMRKLMTFVDAQNVTPAATIFRRKFFLKHGKFDVNNLTEDFEMGMRIHSKHYKTAHVFDTYVETVVPSTFSQLKRQRVRWSFGGIHNINIYRYMISPKYGDLGLFIIPMMLIGLALLPLITVYYLLALIWDTIHGYYLLSLIGFDFKYQVFAWFQDFMTSSYEFRYFIFAAAIVISVLTYALAAHKMKEKFNPMYLVYFLVYGILLMYFNVIALARFLFVRKPKW